MKQSIEITEKSGVAEARRMALRFASDLGLSSECEDRLAIVVTEMGTNLLRHASGGHILLHEASGTRDTSAKAANMAAARRLLVASIDSGPGIPEMGRALEDGFSTLGSGGVGLGAMVRLSDSFDIYSEVGCGTVICCAFGAGNGTLAGVEVAGFRMNHPGEFECGDNWVARVRDGMVEILVLDGLGHGPRAAAAADAALAAFANRQEDDMADLMGRLSEDVRSTRGSVGSLVWIEAANGRAFHTGIGNVTAMVASPGASTRRLISRDGRLGGPARTLQVEVVALGPRDTLILHSDGIATLRGIDRMGGLLRHSPGVIAAALMRDNNRGRDDACVVTARLARTEG